jgi:hypothetical protein
MEDLNMSIVNVYSNTVRISWCIFRTLVVTVMDTWQEAFVDKPSQNMNAYVRWELFFIGCVFFGITMGIDAPLQWLVLLPLIGIYLIQTAIIGYEPIYYLIQRLGNYLHKHSLMPKVRSLSYVRTSS